jgi:HK97 family phage major capsid protein
MPDEKIKTKEQLYGFVSDVVKEVMNATWEEMQKANQATLAAMQREAAIEKAEKPERGLMAARFMRAIAAGKGDTDKAARFAKKQWGEQGAILKALEASDASAGGVLIPTEWSGEVIELLREATVFRRMGPRVIPMTTGSMQMSKLTGGATAGYIGESQNLPVSEQTFGQINLTWKKLACLVPISNDLLRFNAYGADTIVRDDSIGAMAFREDAAFLRDDGTEHTPKGIRHWALAAGTFDAQASPDLTKITQDTASAILKMRNADCRMLRPAWFWAPRTELGLKTLRDGNGNLVYKPEMDGGNYWGFPYFTTNQIPINLGTGSDSEIYLCDMADLILGEANRLEVSASDVAAYDDGGTLKAAFSLDQTVLRLIAHHDFACRHQESVVVMEKVLWAPA